MTDYKALPSKDVEDQQPEKKPQTPSVFSELWTLLSKGGKIRKTGVDLRGMLLCISVGCCMYLLPCPAGLKPEAWRLFGLFLTTILAIIMAPLPVGAVAMISLSASMLTNTLTFAQAFSGFATPVPWLIGFAFLLSRGFIKSGLGSRIGYILISKMGGTSLGLTYSLVLTELVIAPCIPSVAARAGGILKPLVESVALACESTPKNGTQRKIGSYLMVTMFQTSCISSAMFLTAMAANPLAASIAATNKISLSWGLWAKGAMVPGVLSLILLPLVLYKLYPPEMKRSPEVPILAREKLVSLGKVTKDEMFVAFTFLTTVLLWVFGETLSVPDVAAAGVGLTMLLCYGIVTWEEMLKESAAWDTMFWFAALISLADNLKKFGFMTWMSSGVVKGLEAMKLEGVLAMVVVCLFYLYSHYMFASGAAHVGAMYGALLVVAVEAGAPPVACALMLGYFGNLMGCLTHYGIGSAPPYFALGYVPTGIWWGLGFVSSLVTVGLFVGVGLPWWRILGIL